MNGTEFNVVKLEDKPFEKLIETVSNGIGSLYKPRAIRKEADAEAYKMLKLAEANAKIALINDEVSYELLERAKERFVLQEVNRQINIENTVEGATKYLAQTVSEEPVNADWRTKYFNKVQDVSDKEMQDIWSKILAEEVNNPGRTSLRTLEIVSNLNRFEAELFQIVCGLTVNNTHVFKVDNSHQIKGFGLNFESILTLKAAGLIHQSDGLNVTFDAINDQNFTVVFFAGLPIRISHSYQRQYVFDQFALTPAASELSKVIRYSPNLEYLNALATHYQTRGYEIKMLEISQ